MLLVLGAESDPHPLGLVQNWRERGHHTELVTPAALCRPGWRLVVGQPAQARAGLADRSVPVSEVEAVVSALPWVSGVDLPHVVEEDRDYVAQEIMAFLLAWLTQLRCPVLDAPSAVSLTGCARTPVEWAAIAAGLGIAADPEWSGPTTTVTAVGGCPVGAVPDTVAQAVRTLTSATGRQLITFRFASAPTSPLVGVESRPEVGQRVVGDAILDLVTRR